MLTDMQKSALKYELLEMKEQLIKTEEGTSTSHRDREGTEELSMYDNHPGDMGTELYEREKDMALNVHAEGELRKVENALLALQDGTYGKCEECQANIPFERLQAIPYTTLCVEHAVENVPDDPPVENDQLIMANTNTFSDRRSGASRDSQDSFQEIARSGTSETPSDFVGDHDSYTDLYDNDLSDGAAEDIEEFTSTDMSGQSRGFVRSDASDAYEKQLDEENIESIIGDIPYHYKDSYIHDEPRDEIEQ